MLGRLHRYSWTFVFALAVPFVLWYANEGYVRESREAGRRTRGWEAAARAGVEAARVLSRAETGMWAAVRSGGTCADYEGYSASWASGSVTAVVSFDKARNNNTAAGTPLIPERVCNSSAAAPTGDGSGGAPHWYTYALANVTTSLPDARWYSPSLLLLSTSDTVTLVEFEMEALLRPTNLPGGTHLVGIPARHSPTLGVLSAPLPLPLPDAPPAYAVCTGPCPTLEPARQPGEIWSVGSTTFYRTLLLHKSLPLGVTATTARGRRLFMEWWQAAVAYVAGVAVFLVVYVVPLRRASERLLALARHAETIEIDQNISPETLLYSYSRPKEPAFFDEVRAVEDAYCRFTRFTFAVAACVPEAARRSSALIIAEADLVRERSSVEAAGFSRRGSGRRAMHAPEPLAASSRAKHGDSSQDTDDFGEYVERRVQISSPASAACESKESRYAPSGVCDASPQHEDSELEVQDSIMLLTQEDALQPMTVPELVHDMSPRPFGMSVNSQPSSCASPRSSPKGSTASQLSRSRLSECSLTSSSAGGNLARRASCLSAHSAASGRDEEVGTLSRSSYVSMYTKGQLHRLVESDADKKQVTLANEPDPPPNRPSLEVEILLNTPSNFSDRRLSDSHGLHGLIDPSSPTRDEGKQPAGQPAGRGKRGRGFSQGGLGVRPKRATVMYCEIDVLSNNTQKLEEHIDLSNIMLDCVLHNLKMSDGVPVAVSGNQIVAGWNTHAPQKEHVLSGMQALWNIRQTLQELLGNDCPWAVALASGNTFSGFTGVHDTKHAVVGGETVSLCIDMIHLAPILRCRVLCNEGVYDRAKSTYDMRAVELIPLPSDPIDNGDVPCQGGTLARENTYDQSSLTSILLPGMPGEGPESDGSGAKSHCIYDVVGPTSAAQPLNLSLYNDGFAAYRARSYDQCVRMLTEHLESIAAQDYQAYRVLRNALFFKQNPAAAPQLPFTRVKIGWENYEELAAGEEEEFIASFDPPLQLESAAHVMVCGGKWKSAFRAGVSAIKVSTRIAATQRRAEEDKKQEANRLKTDILKATSAAGGVSQGNEKFVIDRKGLRWSRSDKQLGVGAFGEVYQGMSEEGSLVAMKFLNLPKKKEAPTGRYAHRKRAAAASAGPSIEQATAELVNEVDLLTKLRHDNVVAYLASIVSGNQIVICMEYMSGGSLQTMLSLYKRLPLTAVSRYLTDILKGLKFLHGHNIVHRDIKPDNVLLHIDGQGKLSDFGTSGQLAAIAGKVSVQGTPMYMAPEQARGFGVAASDIWSLGITVVQLVTGAVPWVFTEQNPYMTHNFIYRLGNDTTFRPQVVDDLPKSLHEMLDQCLLPDHHNRPVCEDLLRWYAHTNSPPTPLPPRSRKCNSTFLREAKGDYRSQRSRQRGSREDLCSEMSSPSGSKSSVTSLATTKSDPTCRLESSRKENGHVEIGQAQVRCVAGQTHGSLQISGGLAKASASCSHGHRTVTSAVVEALKSVVQDAPSGDALVPALTNAYCAARDKAGDTELPSTPVDTRQLSLVFAAFPTADKLVCLHTGGMRAALCRSGRLLDVAAPEGEESSPLPHVTVCDITSDDSFLVLATTSVWTRLGGRVLLDTINEKLTTALRANRIGLELVDKCAEESRPSPDEPIAIVIVNLRTPPKNVHAGCCSTTYSPLLRAWQRAAAEDSQLQRFTFREMERLSLPTGFSTNG